MEVLGIHHMFFHHILLSEHTWPSVSWEKHQWNLGIEPLCLYTEEFVIYWNTDILSKHYHVYPTTNHCRWPDCNWFCCSKLYRLFRPQQFFQITFHAMTAGYSSTVWEDFRLSKWSINEAKSKTCKLCRRVQQVA